ncbi:hypothetical protein D3C87_1665290 [compost metagenome]
MALGQQAARRTDHHLPAVGVALFENEAGQVFLGTEAQTRATEQFVADEAIVYLRDVDVRWRHARARIRTIRNTACGGSA